MNKQLLPVVIALLFSHELFSQTNCSSPYVLNICPDVYLSNQSNLAMIDDAPALYNIAGEDIVYQINVPITTTKLFLTVVSATGPYRATLAKTNCNSTPTYSANQSAGSSNFYFTVSNATTYYFWIDAASTISFDIAIGADTASTIINIPNTQGALEFDPSGCAIPFFNPAKPYYQVFFNNVVQTDPMTLSPLFTAGTMCISTFFRNLTGVEAISKFLFDFDVNGYSNIQCPDSIPGRYTAGYWISTISGNKITYDFVDSLNTGIGDFDGTPNSCLEYQFCFDLIPLSNSPQLTNIDVQMNSDNKGAPYSGTLNQGCCPSTIPNCHGSGGGGGGGGGHAFGFGVNDPGTSLPIELLNFNLVKNANKININWSTASETNNDYFSIERSKNGYDWTVLKTIPGAGNSTTTNNYATIDEDPYLGISYYRLKQTDYDGKFSYPAIKSILNETKEVFNIYPNPTIDQLTIEYESNENYEIYLYSNLGNKTSVPVSNEIGKAVLHTAGLQQGIYFLFISQNNELKRKEIISIMK